jgi:hypothetical protein
MGWAFAIQFRLVETKGGFAMSSYEKATALLNQVPEYQLDDVVAYLQGVIAGAIHSDQEIPNAETIAAMKETEEMARNGTGEHFTGSTTDFLASILVGDD